jgi:dihydroxy-acid dehydratase
VGQLEDGACIKTRSMYTNIVEKKGTPRHSH